MGNCFRPIIKAIKLDKKEKKDNDYKINEI